MLLLCKLLRVRLYYLLDSKYLKRMALILLTSLVSCWGWSLTSPLQETIGPNPFSSSSLLPICRTL